MSLGGHRRPDEQGLRLGGDGQGARALGRRQRSRSLPPRALAFRFNGRPNDRDFRHHTAACDVGLYARHDGFAYVLAGLGALRRATTPGAYFVDFGGYLDSFEFMASYLYDHAGVAAPAPSFEAPSSPASSVSLATISSSTTLGEIVDARGARKGRGEQHWRESRRGTRNGAGSWWTSPKLSFPLPGQCVFGAGWTRHIPTLCIPPPGQCAFWLS